jgi:glucokinase
VTRHGRLLGDVGATNARFALCGEDDKAERIRVVPVDDYATLQEAIQSYLTTEGIQKPLGSAALAVASPVVGDAVTMTNHPWSFSISALQRDLRIGRLTVVNDFIANALAVPHLEPQDRLPIGAGTAVADSPIAIVGPGTGLGVSSLIPTRGSWTAVAGEGGHVGISPSDDRESEVLARLRSRYSRVSAERILSGPGLVNLYHALAEIANETVEPYTPAQITDAAISAREPLCRAALGMFCAMLGSFAGDLALTFGARGGVFIAGGIVPRLGSRFAESMFREQFENKGRFHNYVAAIPTYVITAAVPAFIGLVEIIKTME